jgi:predicted P-loop ATPase
MSTTIIINNFENSTDLCENWGWYVYLEPVNEHNNKYKLRKIKPAFIIDISEEDEYKKNDDYDEYRNKTKKYKLKNSLETILEEEEENIYCKNKKKIVYNILRIVPIIIITGILTYIILFAI